MLYKKIVKRALTVLLSVSMLVTMAPFVPYVKCNVEAATTLGEKVVEIADSCNDKKIEDVRKKLKSYGTTTMYLPNYGINHDLPDYDWCAWFASNCARQAGVSTAVFPNTTWAYNYDLNTGFEVWAKQKGYWISATTKSYTKLKAGDLCIEKGHVTIVRKVEGQTIYTIGGNEVGGNPEDHFWWTKSKVNKRKFTFSDNARVKGFISIPYSQCKHTWSTSTGKCTKCGGAFKDNDSSVLDTSCATNVSKPKPVAYKIKTAANIRKYPSTSTTANIIKRASVGDRVQVKGRLKSPSGWYKVVFWNNGSATTGYVLTDYVDTYVDKGDSKVTVTNLETFTVKEGAGHDVVSNISSVYPLKSMSAKYIDLTGKVIASKTKSINSTLYGKVSTAGWDAMKKANNNTKDLPQGEYTLKVTGTDIFGHTGHLTSNIKITGAMKKPTINAQADTERQKVVITSNSAGTLYYKQGKAEYKSITSKSVTLYVTAQGSTKIKAYTKNTTTNDSSLVSEKSVILKKLAEPTINVEQQGKNGIVTITGGDTRYYSLDGGTYKKYVQPFEVNGNTTIKAYTTAKGSIRSDVATYTTDYTEPAAPEVTLANESSNIAEGKTATFNWKQDKCAESYTASLYRTDVENEELVDSQTTEKCTATFTLPEKGEYCVRVIASNDLGDSEESNPVNVTAKAPVLLTFRNPEEKIDGEQETPYLEKINVAYGEYPESVKEPSKKGHTFTGWKNIATDEISSNGYTNRPATEDAVYEAQYEAKTYKVKLYDFEGTRIDIQEVSYGKAVDFTEAEIAVNGMLQKEEYAGYELSGWQVRTTGSGDCEADYNHVDSDMEIHAVANWKNAELPVIVNIKEAKLTYDEAKKSNVVNLNIGLNNMKGEDLSFYLIVALKAKDETKNVDQTVYADRKIVYLDADDGNNLPEKNVSMKIKTSETVNYAEVVAVECKDDMSTGSTYSEIATKNISRDSGARTYGAWSQWSTQKPADAEGRDIETATEYRTLKKDVVKSGKDTLAGYTKESTSTLSTTYGKWVSSAPATSTSVTDACKTVVSVETQAAHRWFSYYCDCGKVCWKTSSGTCQYCGKKTDNLVIAYTTTSYSPNASADNDGSYKFAKTIKSGDANRYCIYYNGNYATSFSSKSTKVDVSYFWKSSTFNHAVYRTKTVKTVNTFVKWDDTKWSDWSNAESKATADLKVETRTVYRYRDEIPVEEASETVNIDESTIIRIPEEGTGTLNVADNLSGKKATIMVYQANNTDPNKYQMKYLGQTEIGEGNSYSFNVSLKEMPTRETGNYIVALGVQGTTGLINVGVIEAPKTHHNVSFFYMDGNEKKQIGEVQSVEDGADADLTDIKPPEREGYCFLGWSQRTTNITSKQDEDTIEIEGIYAPLKNTVVFVDWINQTIQMQSVYTGDSINTPGEIGDAAGHKFIGWKTPDGTVVEAGESIEANENMVIEAAFDTEEYTVRFLDFNGNTIDQQKVEYGKAAKAPEYTGSTGNGEFLGWSTSVNWWSVEGDVDVRPIIGYEETADAPKGSIVELENGSDEEITRAVELETDEEDAEIFYTTNGIEPTYDMVQEYVNKGLFEEVNDIKKYTEPLVLEDDTDVMAVSYVEGKNISEVSQIFFELEPEDNGYTNISDVDGWEEIGTCEIKAIAGKDVQAEVLLDENPGLLGYEILVSADDEVFYADADEYGDPVVDADIADGNGRVNASKAAEGWVTTWYGSEQSDAAASLMKLNLHVNEDAEEGMYPVTVYYAPDNTYNSDYEDVSLENAKVKITSEASIDISEMQASLSRTNYTYDGSKCEPTVTIEGLKEGENFTVEYENNVNAGTAKATIKGIDGYIGTIEKEFTIKPVSIVQANIADIEDQTYTGSEIKPAIAATYNGIALEEGKDYSAAYSGNVSVGTATVTLSGIGNYSGTITKQFAIIETPETKLAELEAALAEAQAALEAEQVKAEELKAAKEAAEAREAEANEALKQAQEALENAKTEKEAAEAQAALDKAAKEAAEAQLEAVTAAKELAEQRAETALTAQQTAEAKQKAAEVQVDSLKIQLETVKNQKETAEAQATLYKAQKEAAEAQAEAANAAKEIAEAKEASAVAAKELAELNEAAAKSELEQAQRDLDVAVAAKEEAEKNADADAEALKAANEALDVATKAKEKAEAAQAEAEKQLAEAESALETAQAEAVKAKADAEKAKADADAKVTKLEQQIKEIEESAGSATNLAEIVVSGIKNKTYTGSPVTQRLVLTVDDVALTAGSDYELGYANNTKVGTAVVTITGKGSYKGKLTRTFKINPKKTYITKLTRGSKAFTVKWSKRSVQTSGYQIRYSLKSSMASAKTKTVSGTSTVSKKITKLKANKRYYVQVRTYKTVNGTRYYSAWSAKKYVKTK